MSKYSDINTSNNNEWDSIPFTVDGVNFVSKIRKDSEMALRIKFVPTSVFVQMNEGAIRDCIGKVSLMSRDEITSELQRVNAGGSQAILELA